MMFSRVRFWIGVFARLKKPRRLCVDKLSLSCQKDLLAIAFIEFANKMKNEGKKRKEDFWKA